MACTGDTACEVEGHCTVVNGAGVFHGSDLGALLGDALAQLRELRAGSA